MFDTLIAPRPDDLMVVAQRVREDERRDKLDLGVGVYRDASGRTPIIPVVRAAAEFLVGLEETKSYLSPAGDPEFVELLMRHVLSPAMRDELGRRVTGLQAPGGTGALRLAAELALATNPAATLWIGLPTWPNHVPVATAAGLRYATYEAIDLAHQRLSFDRLMAALQSAAPGDLVLLQGCCHNPTGIDFAVDEWRELATVLEKRQLVPLIDFAYQGLGVGIDEDAGGVRLLFERLPEAMVAVSCSKSFSLYRERVGLLIVKARTETAAGVASATLQTIVRALYSNPPAHGAALVRTVLERPALEAEWRNDLDAKRNRVQLVRTRLAECAGDRGIDLGFVRYQRGLFSTLPVTPEQAERLGAVHAIHMPASGRINVAGLSEATVPRFVDGLISVGLERGVAEPTAA